MGGLGAPKDHLETQSDPKAAPRRHLGIQNIPKGGQEGAQDGQKSITNLVYKPRHVAHARSTAGGGGQASCSAQHSGRGGQASCSIAAAPPGRHQHGEPRHKAQVCAASHRAAEGGTTGIHGTAAIKTGCARCVAGRAAKGKRQPLFNKNAGAASEGSQASRQKKSSSPKAARCQSLRAMRGRGSAPLFSPLPLLVSWVLLLRCCGWRRCHRGLVC